MFELLSGGGLLMLHLLGLGCLAVSQDKHWLVIWGQAHPRRRNYVRRIGWMSLLLGLLQAWAYQGPVFGSLIWVLMLPLSGYAVVFTLAWHRQCLLPDRK